MEAGTASYYTHRVVEQYAERTDDESDIEMWMHEGKNSGSKSVRCQECVYFKADTVSKTKGYCANMDSGRTEVYRYSYKICNEYERDELHG